MKTLTRLFLCLAVMLPSSLASAQNDGMQASEIQANENRAGARTVHSERWVEEWDAATQSWVRVDNADPRSLLSASAPQSTITTTTTEIIGGVITTQTTTVLRDAARYSAPVTPRRAPQIAAQYGPFQVLDNTRAAMMGSTDAAAPAHFDAMLRDFPDLKVLELIEAPGTSHDLANLALGRRIRAAGISTHVPAGGSVRSGAVELFLAGATRKIDDRAEFAVHSWRDAYGREPDDFAPNAPENRLYLDYYVEMGMSERRARDFYAMTNSVPHNSALWLNGDEMRAWVKERQNTGNAWDQSVAQKVEVQKSEVQKTGAKTTAAPVFVAVSAPVISYEHLFTAHIAAARPL